MGQATSVHFASPAAAAAAGAHAQDLALLCRVLIEEIINREDEQDRLPLQLRVGVVRQSQRTIDGVYTRSSGTLRIFEPGVLQFTDCDLEPVGSWNGSGWELMIECAYGDLRGRTWRAWVNEDLSVVRKVLEVVS